jgi:PKD repeat protein
MYRIIKGLLLLGIIVSVLGLASSCKKEKSVFAVADFTYSGRTDTVPTTIQFINKSFGLTYSWDFGDGGGSTDKNPNHNYNQAGTYRVKLIVRGTNNSDTMEIVIGIGDIIPRNGLVGWWPFNRNADDESGNGNHGTVIGATLSSDRFNNANNCYEIDGINCPLPKGINLPGPLYNGNDYTISIWYKSLNSSKQYQCIINSSPHQFLAANFNYLSNNTVAFFVGNGTWWPTLLDSLTVYNSENWNHLIVIKNGLKFQYFNNSILIKTINFNTVFNSGNISNFIVGASSINGGSNCYETFSGKIDDIGIWNRALTQQEITSLYNRGT